MTRFCLTCQGQPSVVCPDHGHRIEDYPLQMRGKNWEAARDDFADCIFLGAAVVYLGLILWAVIKWIG